MGKGKPTFYGRGGEYRARLREIDLTCCKRSREKKRFPYSPCGRCAVRPQGGGKNAHQVRLAEGKKRRAHPFETLRQKKGGVALYPMNQKQCILQAKEKKNQPCMTVVEKKKKN